MGEVFDFMGSSSVWRKFYWLSTDGNAQILFLVVLVVMMYLWAPHENSWLPPAPNVVTYVGVETNNMKAVPGDDEEAEGLVGTDHAAPRGGELKPSSVAPDEIGVRADEGDEDGTMLL